MIRNHSLYFVYLLKMELRSNHSSEDGRLYGPPLVILPPLLCAHPSLSVDPAADSRGRHPHWQPGLRRLWLQAQPAGRV